MSKIERSGFSEVDAGYDALLEEARASIRASRAHAVRAVNTELLRAYHRIGSSINTRRADEGAGRGRAGTKLVERLAADLTTEFPDMSGLSVQNLRAMARFAAAYPDESIIDGPAGGVPWGHHIDIIGRLKTREERLWYMERAGDWTRKQLQTFIAADLHRREGAALSNFERALEPGQATAAQSLTRDPLLLDFVAGHEVSDERDLELALLAEIEKFMLALGKGFFFVGRQRSLVVGQREFIIDLLFYHHGQRRFVVLELKVGEFDPEFAGKINLYVNAVDEQLADQTDNPTIGIVLCATRDEAVTRLTLKGIASPVAVSTYQLGKGTIEADTAPGDLSPGLYNEINEMKAVEADLQEFATRKVRELDDAAARRAGGEDQGDYAA